MTNEQLKEFYHMDKIQKTAVICSLIPAIDSTGKRLHDGINDGGTTTPAPGLPSQAFYSVMLQGRNKRGPEGVVTMIENSGFRITKSFFKNTHPDAFAIIEEWKATHAEGTAYAQQIRGIKVSVPTKRNFLLLTRVKNPDGTFKMDPVKGTDGKPRPPVSMMTFFVLEDESIEGELRRRGTQLEKNKGWLELLEASHEVGTADPEHGEV